MLAACTAPAYVKAGILMPVRKVWAASPILRFTDPELIEMINRAARRIMERPTDDPYSVVVHPNWNLPEHQELRRKLMAYGKVAWPPYGRPR